MKPKYNVMGLHSNVHLHVVKQMSGIDLFQHLICCVFNESMVLFDVSCVVSVCVCQKKSYSVFANTTPAHTVLNWIGS